MYRGSLKIKNQKLKNFTMKNQKLKKFDENDGKDKNKDKLGWNQTKYRWSSLSADFSYVNFLFALVKIVEITISLSKIYLFICKRRGNS
jgi:hypothetical protein